MTGNAKLSADTIINEETGAPEVRESAPIDAPVLTPDAIASKAKRFVQMRDLIQSRLMAFIAGNPDTWSEYKLENWEFDMFVEVYGPMVAQMGEIPVWMDILIAELIITGPKIHKIIEAKKEKKAIEKIRKENGHTSNDTPTAGATTAQRVDLKTRWIVDEKGYFKHDNAGNYIPQPKRKERPILSNPLNYELLVKYNGEDAIKSIYNV